MKAALDHSKDNVKHGSGIQVSAVVVGGSGWSIWQPQSLLCTAVLDVVVDV